MANSLNEQLDQFVDTALAGQDVALSSVERGIAPLAEIAIELRGLPRKDFKDRLRDDLQRSAIATTTTAKTSRVKPIREGFHNVTPYISVREALELIDFIKKAFGAEGKIYGIGSQGGFHSEFKIGDSIIMIGGGGSWKGTSKPTALHYYVDDVDAVYQRALEAGATSIQGPIEAHGERLAGVKDLAGNEWYIAKRLQGSHTDEGLRTVTTYLHPKGSLGLIAFLKEAFQAAEIAVYQSPEGIVLRETMGTGVHDLHLGRARPAPPPMGIASFLLVDQDLSA